MLVHQNSWIAQPIPGCSVVTTTTGLPSAVILLSFSGRATMTCKAIRLRATTKPRMSAPHHAKVVSACFSRSLVQKRNLILGRGLFPGSVGSSCPLRKQIRVYKCLNCLWSYGYVGVLIDWLTPVDRVGASKHIHWPSFSLWHMAIWWVSPHVSDTPTFASLCWV